MSVTALPFRYAFATNSTSMSFTGYNSTATKPSGDGVFDLLNPEFGVGGGYNVPAYLQLIPFGTDANNETTGIRVHGFSETVAADLVTDTVIYIPKLLVRITATFGARTFSDHAASTFLADTIVVEKGPTDNGPWLSLNSPADDTVASILIHTQGCRFIVFTVAQGTAASTNCLWRVFG